MANQGDKAPIQPVAEYLVNGPIPADQLMYLDFVQSYLDSGIIDDTLDVHFMLERVCVQGAPKWWKGTVAQFEQEFHDQYHLRIEDIELASEFKWRAAYDEVRAGRLSPLPKNATNKQIEEFLSCGKRRREQVWAVELLLDMWVETNQNQETY